MNIFKEFLNSSIEYEIFLLNSLYNFSGFIEYILFFDIFKQYSLYKLLFILLIEETFLSSSLLSFLVSKILKILLSILIFGYSMQTFCSLDIG